MINYTNEQEAIRQSFANFLGALMTNSMYDGKEAKENAIAILCEELVKYSQDDNSIDLVNARPILKSSLWILQKRKQELLNYLNDNNTTYIPQYTKDIDDLIESLDNYIDKIKGGK